MNASYSIEQRKKAVFDSMSQKRRNQILKKVTYEQWNPFEEPKDPIDIRKDKTKRLPSTLIREFLKSKRIKKINLSEAYNRGMSEMIIGLVNSDDRFVAMYEFSLWYGQLLEQEGLEL